MIQDSKACNRYLFSTARDTGISEVQLNNIVAAYILAKVSDNLKILLANTVAGRHL